MKNFFVIIVSLAIQFKAIAQTSIKVISKPNLKIDSVSIIDISQKEYHNFPYSDTLNFRFDKQNIDCYNLRYFVKGKLYWKQLWLDAGNVTIETHTDSAHLIIDTVINSPAYYNVINYLKKSSQFSKDTLKRNNFLMREIQNNIENPRSIAIANDYINLNQNSKSALLKLKILLSKQKTDFSWFLFYTIGIERMNKILEIKSILLADFKFLNRKNETVNINLTNNDYYILDFWFVGCVPCVQQHKEIKSNYVKLKNNKIEVIGICIDKKPNPWNKYLIEHNYTWNNYLQTGNNTLSNFLSITAFPAYVILNKKGDILSSYSSLSDVFSSFKINSN